MRKLGAKHKSWISTKTYRLDLLPVLHLYLTSFKTVNTFLKILLRNKKQTIRTSDKHNILAEVIKYLAEKQKLESVGTNANSSTTAKREHKLPDKQR